MKFPRTRTHFRSLKFAPFAILFLFIFTNITGIMFSRVLAPVAAASPAELDIPADVPTSGDKELDRIIFEVGEREGVDPRFIHAVIWQESKYDRNARSHAGAQGLMQLMPATAKRFGCDDPTDEESNVNAGVKYLRVLLKRFDGDVTLALAGYNAGEGNVDKYEGVPPFGETQNYVRVITGRYGKTYHPVLAPEEAAAYFKLLPSQAQELAAN